MSQQQAIFGLLEKRWSHRRIARELGVDRKTIRRLVRQADRAKSSISTAGSEPPNEVSCSPALAGRKSHCVEFEARIHSGLETGLTAQRIYQDLVVEHQFSGSYQSVKRFVRKLGNSAPIPWRRMECEPGEEAQVDFGTGAWIMVDGKRKRSHLFRIVLSYSRKAYSEAIWRQTTEGFIRALENAFRHFGGVPHTLVIDNLRAAVTRADWYDPRLNPKILLFAEHYKTVVLPTKPYTPRHKGKVEAGVKYAQNNALKGRAFESLAEENRFLAEWEKNIADKRIHGTTRKQVEVVFATVEKPKLLPLPVMVFPCFEEAPRHVHLDGHVEVRKTYYSVPPEYAGRKVWARWDTRLVRVFNQRMEQIALHARQEPGRFCTHPSHIHSRRRSIIENGLDYLMDRARLIGPRSGEWAEAMLKNRGPRAIRVLQGFLRLAAKQTPANIEAASQLGCSHGLWRLDEIKALLQRPTRQEQFEFIQVHPLIRGLNEYQALVPDCFCSSSETPNTSTQETNHESLHS